MESKRTPVSTKETLIHNLLIYPSEATSLDSHFYNLLVYDISDIQSEFNKKKIKELMES